MVPDGGGSCLYTQGVSQLAQIAEEVLDDVLRAIDVRGPGMRSVLEPVASVVRAAASSAPRLVVISVGKAAGPLLDAWLSVSTDDPAETGVCVGSQPKELPDGFSHVPGCHPVPGPQSQEAADLILGLLEAADAATRIVFLLSGGASAMVERPLWEDVSLGDLAVVHGALVGCGATIGEINTVRKHLSATKGGRLAQVAAPARLFTVMVSDVPNDNPHLVASGPTLPDPTTVDQCCAVIERHGLLDALPESVRRRITARDIPETPKPESMAPADAFTVLGSHDAMVAAHSFAEARGFVARIATLTDEWPVENAAEELVLRLRSLKEQHPDSPVALIADGEVLSPVQGPGVGGRNQAFVLACASLIAGDPVCVLSAGTDGIDGNSSAAGGWVDGETVARAEALGLDGAAYAARSDSHAFLDALGQTVVTGPTGNNVRDLRILLAE